MKVSGISVAGNQVMSPARSGKLLQTAKRGLIPLVLAGGLLLSNSLKAQDLKQDVVSISKTQQTEQTNQVESSEGEEKAAPWYTFPLCMGLAVLVTFGIIKLSDVITKHAAKNWTEEDVKYWSEDHPGW